MKNPSAIWYPKDILGDPGVLSLSLEAEGAWRRTLDAIVVDGEAGALVRTMSWWAGFLRVTPSRAAELLGEIRRKRVGQVNPDPEADVAVSRDAEVTVSCRRLVRLARSRALAAERQRRIRTGRCGKAATKEAGIRAPENHASRSVTIGHDRSRTLSRSFAMPQVLVAAGIAARHENCSRDVTPRFRTRARAALTQYQYPSTDSHPPAVRAVERTAVQTPVGGSLVRSGLGSGPSPACSPSVRRCAPHDADRRAPTPMRELLAALVPTLAPASTGMGLGETECRSDARVVATAAADGTRQDAPYAIRDPIALAVRAWRSGKSVGSGTWGLHVALRAAAHAIREGREQLRLFWHLLRTPLRAWCRTADDDAATAWMRQVRVRTC